MCRYHLTDVPSIVSGPYLVYLDPHAQYLFLVLFSYFYLIFLLLTVGMYVPGATSAHPGIKIDFTKSGVANIFPGN
jgi:hypothetical protein